MRSLLGAAVAALCVTLSACGGGGGGGGGGNTPAPQNSAPTFGALSFSTPEDTDLTIRIPASDAEGEAITFIQLTQPTRGSVVSINVSTGDITYRPNANATGADSFRVRATDAGGRATDGTVSIAISAVNDAPTAQVTAMVADQGTTAGSRIVASDVEGDAVTFTLTRPPSSGTVSAFAADGSFTYQPAAQFAGNDSFDVTVTDAQGGSTLVTVPITVSPSALAYNGSQSQVVITEGNAGQISKSLWDNFSRLIALYEAGARSFIPAPPATVDTTLDGLSSGAARITGSLDAAGSGSFNIVYSGYSQNGTATFNGVEVVDVELATNTVRRNYKRTAVTLGNVTTTASGTLVQQITTTNNLSGNIVFGFPDGSTTWMRDVQLTFAGQPLRRPLTFSINTWRWNGMLRMYDPTRGYGDVELDGGLNFERTTYGRSDFTRPIGRGSLAATGAAQAKLWTTSLSPYTVGVELDLGARGRPEKSLAFRRRDGFSAPAGSDSSHVLQAAVAYPFDAVHAEIGLPFYPEGRFSEHRDGTFLTHRWYIDVAPPGSTAQLELADTPRPYFTADRVGQYLLRVEVSAGGITSTDYLTVQSSAQGQAPEEAAPNLFERSIPGASDPIAVGTEITLDARRSYDSFGDSSTIGYRWTVTGPTPSGSGTLLNAVSGEAVRFTPNLPGVYYAVFHRPDTTSLTLVEKEFTVGAPRFSPHVRFTLSSDEHPTALDFDGDGYVDILSEDRQNPRPMILYRGRAGGRFHDGIVIQGLNNNDPHWFEDVTGDGRLDLIRLGATQEQITVAEQLSTGQFGTPVTLDNGSPVCSFPTWRVLGAIDIDRNGRKDLVRALFCSGSVSQRVVVNTSSASGFDAAQDIPLPFGNLFQAAIADIDGDGDRDLIAAPYPNALPSEVVIMRLNNGGTFDPTTVPTSEPYQPQKLIVSDIDNDGRMDVFVGTAPNMVLTQNANGTFTETAKIPGYLVGSGFPQFGDFTDDGRQDMVIDAALYVQRSDRTFEDPVPYTVPGSTFIDLNGDGRLDTLSRLNFMRIRAPQ